jgi:predicted DNA-binding transcriptional regulator YafY
MLKYPVWYVLAFDHLRAEPRTFRCDRILSASRTGTRFRLLPKREFRKSLHADDLAP